MAYALTGADRQLVRRLSEDGQEARLTVRELAGCLELSTRSWVGLVRFEGLDVRIEPKLAGGDLGLVELVAFTTGLDALERSAGARTLHAEGTGLFDLIALLLSEQCDHVLRAGLLADYVEQEDELPVVRGRLLADRQLLRRYGEVDRLWCRYDSHEQDIVENQLLAAALGQCASRVEHELTRQRVRRQLAIFLEACAPERLDLRAARGGLEYHRLNAHYSDAHALAWLVLDGLGTTDLLASGATECFTFLIDMNRLFERFVYLLVERLLTPRGLRVDYQLGDDAAIVHAGSGTSYARVIPDVLVETRTGARVAIDAKYKLYDERGLDGSDVYQAHLYAHAYGAAVILYPQSRGGSSPTRLRIRGSNGRAPTHVVAMGVPIPLVLSELRGGAGGSVTRALVAEINGALP